MALVCGALFGLLLGAGCQSARVQEPLTQKLGGSDPDTQMEFWHQLADRPVTSNDEAFHGFLLYVDGKDANTDYAGRVAAMKDRGFLPAGFNADADQAIRRGDLAVAITQALKIRGGLMMHLGAARVPRYATRELVYLDVYPPSSTNQTFSGSEFLGIIGRVEDWERGNTDRPASQLPGDVKQ